MWINYSIPEEVRISIEEYLRGVLNNFPDEITEKPETPAASNLLNIRDNKERELLNETWARAFNHAVAQIILSKI